MPTIWQPYLDRWTAAGVMDAGTAARITDWENEHSGNHGLRWPILAALAFGALLLSAGILLFVSAHWDEISPDHRMVLLLSVIGTFHVAGALTAQRFEALSITLHTIGTVALGGAIALAGQTYHLSEHWPGAIMLWALGSAVAWGLLGHWTQGLLTAILAPAWLLSEWAYGLAYSNTRTDLPILLTLCALSILYLAARRSSSDGSFAKGLGWVGGIALIPSVLFLAANLRWSSYAPVNPPSLTIVLIVLGVLALAAFAHGKSTFGLGIALFWTLLWPALVVDRGDNLLTYAWCALGSVGLVAWGVQLGRPERINLGMTGFAITLLAFYFSSVMDKLGRSASLIGLGLLFLAGGWFLERLRRQFIAKIQMEAA